MMVMLMTDSDDNHYILRSLAKTVLVRLLAKKQVRYSDLQSRLLPTRLNKV